MTFGVVSVQPCGWNPVRLGVVPAFGRQRAGFYCFWTPLWQRRGFLSCGLQIFLVPMVNIHYQRFQACPYNYSYFLPQYFIPPNQLHPPLLSSFTLHLNSDDPAVISPFQLGRIGNAYTQIITCSQTNVAINVVYVSIPGFAEHGTIYGSRVLVAYIHAADSNGPTVEGKTALEIEVFPMIL